MATATTPVSPITARYPFAANSSDEISQVWKQVEDRVLQMAGGDRAMIKPGLSIDEVLYCLDDAQADDKKAAGKYGAVKKIFNQTLQCIQTIGGIVADGASQVFQPANTCYNALTFVIQAWKGYEGIFESLAMLLEKCTQFLDRLSEYTKTEMDAKLTKVACQHLYIFVEICDRSMKLRQKRAKFAAFMKQMFLNDDGVQDLLSQMKNLVDKERGLVAAQTFRFSNEAAVNTKENLALTYSLVDDKNQQKRDIETKKRKQTLIGALEFESSAISGDTQEPVDDWKKVWFKHKKELIDGTGAWISKNPLFTSWLKGSDSAKPILGLEGGDGAGKTLLAANIVMLLQKLRSADIFASRSAVAYYFLQTDSKATSIKRDIANSLSKSLLWQLAKADEPFLKSVAGICEKTKFFKNHYEDMWTQLLFENEERVNMDSVFFIVVDGLGDDVDGLTQLLQKLSVNPARQRTRVLLTGNTNTFGILEKAGGIKFDKIKLEASNAQDIELYITARMDGMDMLKDRSRPDISEVRDRILEDLKIATGGDYYKLSQVLDNIAKSGGDPTEIDDCLKAAGQTRPDQIIAEIKKLNEERTPKEIAEINEIILWVNDGRAWLQPSHMEAALALRAGKVTDQQASLLSLESKISTKYRLFHISDGDIDYKLSEAKDSIPLKKRERSDDKSSSGFIEIQPAEVNMLKHYLSNICPPDVYEKFGFDEFFDLKLVRKANYICYDADNAHITLALRCLSCLVEQRTDKTEKMHAYSYDCLYEHLKATDLSLADRDLKAEVGKMLVRLFTEEYGIQSLLSSGSSTGSLVDSVFSSQSIPPNWHSWIFSDDGVGLISTWFKDSAVIEGVSDAQLVMAYNTTDANHHEVLFELGSKLAAKKLFREKSTRSESLDMFVLLRGFLKKWTDKGPDLEEKSNSLDYLWKPTLEGIQLVEDWSQKSLGVNKDTLWETQMANLLLYVRGEHITNGHSEARARKALELDPDNWRASWTLARVVESQDEAVAILSGLIERLANNAEWHSQKTNKTSLAEMLIDLGDTYWRSTDRTALAVEAYLKSLDESRSLFRQYFVILEALAERKEFQSIILFLEKLIVDTDTDEDTNNITKFIAQTRGISERFNTCLDGAVQSTGRWDILDKLYSKVVTGKADYFDLYAFRRQYGVSLAKTMGREEAGCTILERLFEDRSQLHEEDHVLWVVTYLPADIVPVYTKLATSKDTKQEKVEAIVDKVENLYKLFGTTTYARPDSNLAFARYFHLRGDDLRARKILKATVKQALEMLSDDDLDNDETSFWDLSRVFSTLQDEENVFAAWDLKAKARRATMAAYKAKEKELQEKKAKQEEKQDKTVVDGEVPADGTLANPDEAAGSSDEKELEIPYMGIASCDGCGDSWTYATGMWTCADDFGNIQFDEKCYEKLQAGKLENKICDKDHTFYHIGKRDEAVLDEVEDGSVLVGGRVITLEDWKGELKAKYVDFDAVVALEKEGAAENTVSANVPT
ncbi:hypothetical protein GGS24DRAFT_163990 [Hypoxylon argillaceum]|nr:hypothetical protein GGS24DRAFT_163990 [Hypoxylon argillaceum]